MRTNIPTLRWSYLAGAVYFVGVAIAHLLGAKLPGLFIYFDVPSHGYQDSIIGSLAWGWAVFLGAAAWAPAQNPHLVRTIPIAGTGTLLGLASVNLRTDFTVLGAGLEPRIYWLQWAVLGLYLGWLALCTWRARP